MSWFPEHQRCSHNSRNNTKYYSFTLERKWAFCSDPLFLAIDVRVGNQSLPVRTDAIQSSSSWWTILEIVPIVPIDEASLTARTSFTLVANAWLDAFCRLSCFARNRWHFDTQNRRTWVCMDPHEHWQTRQRWKCSMFKLFDRLLLDPSDVPFF